MNRNEITPNYLLHALMDGGGGGGRTFLEGGIFWKARELGACKTIFWMTVKITEFRFDTHTKKIIKKKTIDCTNEHI